MKNFDKLMLTCLMTPIASPRVPPEDPLTRWGLPANLIGLSGVGKSAHFRRYAEALGLQLRVLYPATLLPEDIGGALMNTPQGPVIMCCLRQVNDLVNIGGGILAIDELSTARDSMQASLLGVVQEKAIAGMPLPPEIRVICAMNPAERAAGGYELSAPMANRLVHFEYEVPTASEWRDYMLGTDTPLLNVPNAKQRVIDGWGAAYSSFAPLVGGFLSANRTLLHAQPDAGTPEEGGAWPSHRTWEWAVRGVTTAKCLGFGESTWYALVKGCVGAAVVPQLIEYVKAANLPDPEDMLRNGWKVNTKRLDVIHAALSSMVLCLLEKKEDSDAIKLGNTAWRIIDDVIDNGYADVAAVAASQLLKGGFTYSKPRKLGDNPGPNAADNVLCADARQPLLRLNTDGIDTQLQRLIKARL